MFNKTNLAKSKILYLTNGLGSGGTEIQLVNLATNFPPQYPKPIVAYYLPLDFFAETLSQAGVAVFYVPKRRGIGKFLPWQVFGFLRAIDKIIKENNVGLVHSFSWGSNFWARVLKIFNPRLKVVVSHFSTVASDSTNVAKQSWEERKFYSWERGLRFLVDGVVVNAPAIKDIYSRRSAFPPERIKVLDNPFDWKNIRSLKTKSELAKLYHFTPSGWNFICAARIISRKDQLCQLQALVILRSWGISNITLHLVGEVQEQKYYQRLQRFVRENQLEKQVKFWGQRRYVLSLMRAADLHILSSRWEGMPNAVIEAMAVGTPVLVSDVADIERLTGEWGMIFKKGDAQDLALKIKQFIALPAQRRQEMGERGSKYVQERFEASRVVKDLFNFYQQIFDK